MTTAALADIVTVTEPGVFTMSNEEYHSDPSPGALSASGAKKLLAPYCPAIYRYEREHPVYKDVFDFGSAAHQLILGDVDQVVEVIEAPDFKTKAAQQARDKARAGGRVPVLAGRWAEIQEMAAAIRRHPIASKLFDPASGRAEQSLFWVDSAAGIWRRARLDWLPHTASSGRLVVPDYKTARSADPETWAKSAADYGYHQQASWYLDGIRALGLDEEPAFVFVVQEKTPPFLVTVCELDETAMTIGRNRNREAINVYADCTESGKWPGYADDVQLVALPAWYEKRFDE